MKQFFKLILIACTFVALSSANTIACSTTGASGTTTCPSQYECKNEVCVHVSLFPLTGLEVAGLFLTVLITGLASAGGNGGGVILTPILLIFFGYTETQAIMTVYSMIFGGAIGNFLNTGLKRNSKTGKPYLNYDLTLICMPPMLLGTSVGIILNRTVAPIIIIVGLLALTSYTLVRVSSKARSEYSKETVDRRREKQMLAEEGLLNSLSETTDADSSRDEIDEITSDEYKIIQPVKLLKNIAVLAFMIILSMFRGSPNFSSLVGFPYCGVMYWMMLVVGIIGCGTAFYFNQRSVRASLKAKEDKAKEAARFGIYRRPDDFELKTKHIGQLLALSLFAGVMAGMFGIGGGTVMSPTLLGIGIKAQALAATSGFFVLQTSFMSLIAAILYGEVPIGTLGFFFLVSCLGSMVVSYFLNKLVKRYQRPSIILFSLLFVFAMALFATPIYEIVSNIHSLDNLLIFNDFC